MKKNIFILVYFLFLITNFSSVLFSEDTEEASQIINLESSNLKYDFGSIAKDTVTKRAIIVLNKLNEALEIKDARSTCECVKIKVQPQTVDRNGIFEAEIAFDSTGIEDQKVEEVVYIMTSNRQYELIRLVIIATIAEPQ